MKTDRRTFIKSMNRVLAGAIGMLGFAGCNIMGAEEYGTPHADYTVKGAVVNKATKKPVGGIRVGYNCASCVTPMYGVQPTPFGSKAHVLTNAKGEFKLTDSLFSENNKILPVYFEDIDGENNGLYQMEYLQVDFSNAEHSEKPQSWYEGEYTVTLNVEMSEVEKE